MIMAYVAAMLPPNVKQLLVSIMGVLYDSGGFGDGSAIFGSIEAVKNFCFHFCIGHIHMLFQISVLNDSGPILQQQ